MRGSVQVERVGSQVLKGNPLGDPSLRDVPVYLPPSYLEAPRKRYPVVFFLTGFTGTGTQAINVHPWKENIAERLDRLIAAEAVRECILVIPDCFTRYGGSQYVNSSGAGRYEDHVVEELVGYVDSKFRTISSPEGRAVMGKSSGGYGAMVLAMRHPDVFHHMACHSGDMFFELCYGRDIPKCVDQLADYGGKFANFLKAFNASRTKDKFPHELVNMAGMASCYSPDAKSPFGFALPFDERTGERVQAVWARWLAQDPVHLAYRHARNLRRLKTLFFDCGSKDEFYLHLGARRLSAELKFLRVKHVYEEHPLGHFNMSERYDVSLRRLSAAFPRGG